jgi:outer membrane immunogenic protein
MKHYLFGALSALALTAAAAPAAAQDTATSIFNGPRIGFTVSTGGDDVIDDDGQTIGVDVGYDFDMGGAVFGIGAEYQNGVSGDLFDGVNETALIARVGGKMGDNALVYATGGLTRINTGDMPFSGPSDEGFRLGGGVEFGLGSQGTSVKLEQRYTDYGSGVNGWQTVAGVNFRF